MNKDEILAKSRVENKNQDLYEKEVLTQASRASAGVMLIMISVYYVVEIIIAGEINLGIFSLLTASNGAQFWVKWAKLHRSHELAFAMIYTLLTVALIGLYIWKLVARG